MFNVKWKQIWESAEDLVGIRQSSKLSRQEERRSKFKPREREKTFTWEEIAEMVKENSPTEMLHEGQANLEHRPSHVQILPAVPVPPIPIAQRSSEKIRVIVLETKAEYYKKRQDWWRFQMAAMAKCERCKRPTELTLDHIIPQQLLLQMGFDTERLWDEENFQILCRWCNTFKSNKLDFSNPKTKPLMFKYLDLIQDLPKQDD